MGKERREEREKGYTRIILKRKITKETKGIRRNNPIQAAKSKSINCFISLYHIIAHVWSFFFLNEQFTLAMAAIKKKKKSVCGFYWFYPCLLWEGGW